jgi:RND family efflux transporter MFP subunit
LVEENQAVRPGQVLATLNLTEIEAGVRQAELAVEKAERDLKRAGKLYKDSVATLEQFQNAQTGLDVAKKQLEAAAFNKQYAQITALHAGVVSKKLANPGQVVGPGTPVLQTTGAGADSWRLRVGLSDREWSKVQVGNSATVETDLPGAKEIPAHIIRKAEVADPINGTYSIELAPNKPVQNLANGLFGKAIIHPKDGVGLVRVPYSALLDGDKGTAFVYITPDGKTVYKRQVTIAAIEREEALIGSGLKAGDQIIVSGSPYLAEGSAIKIQE